MPAFFNGLTGAVVQITGGTGVLIPNSSQTFISTTGTGNGAMQTIRTVTAGKTYYVFSIDFGVPGVAGTAGAIGLYANDGTTLNAQIGGVSPFYYSQNGGGAPIAVYTTGQAVKVQGTTAGTYCVRGVEV